MTQQTEADSAARSPADARPDQQTWWKTLLRKGPVAIFASALPGGVNYAIILFLSFNQPPQEVGIFRILISIFAMANLFALSESQKIYIRAVAQNDRTAGAALFMNQTVFALALFLACATALFLGAAIEGGRFEYARAIIVVTAISAVYMPTQSYMAYFQSKRWFLGLAVTETLKYGSALSAFVLATTNGVNTSVAVYIQLAVMAAWNVIFFLIFARQFIDFSVLRERTMTLLGVRSASEARMISLAVVAPGVLEHLDKFVLGAAHGIAAVGVYALGYSTGRFLYNILKPATYVFWRGYVDQMPPLRTLAIVCVGFSAFGAAMAAAFFAAVKLIPAMEAFRDSQYVTVILFLSWGVALADAIYTQSYSINKDRSARDVLVANVTGALIAMPLIIAGGFVPAPGAAMIVLALYYPVRHLAIMGTLWRLDAHHRKRSAA
ncbi:MAG: hypothetical protein AAFY22_10240 [Pseudomonadota bacterium]